MTTQARELAGLIDNSGNVTAGGNLTVSGTTTTVSSTVETHADPLIELNTGAGSNANDLGFVFERGSTGNNACLIWDESNDAFAVGTTTATGTSTGNMSYTVGDFLAGKVTVDNVIINGTTIGHTDDTDLITLADGALTVAGTLAPSGVLTANAGVVVDNITIDGTEIDLSSGDLTLDVAGDIILDADGADVKFSDGGTHIGTFTNSSSDFVITSAVQDKAIVFKGDDNGSAITALTLDMSDAGTATFNHDVNVGGDVNLTAGALSITADGNNAVTFTESSAGMMTIAAPDDIILDAVSDIILDADGADIRFRDGGAGFFTITNSSLDAVLKVEQSNEDLLFKGNDGGSEITALTLDMSEAGAATFNNLVDATNYKIGGSQGSDGQLMTSTGSGVAWEDAPAGGITYKSGGTSFTSSLIVGHSTTGTLSGDAIGNTALGINAMQAITSADGVTALGKDAGKAITSGGNNTIVGYQCAEALNTGTDNTAIGYYALGLCTNGVQNTAVGRGALDATGAGTDGSYNVAVGNDALGANTQGQFNVAIGRRALYTNTTADENTAVGYLALYLNETGANNTAVGNSALQNNTASNNTAVGDRALTATNSGDESTAVGKDALYANTTADHNTAVGYQAGYSNTAGGNNTYVGHSAGKDLNYTSGEQGTENTFVGYQAGAQLTTASRGTYIGRAAGGQMAQGPTHQTAVGMYALSANYGVRNTAVGYGCLQSGSGSDMVAVGSNLSSTGSSSLMFGYNISDNTSDEVMMGDSSSYYTLAYSGSGASWAHSSDERMKKDITTDTLGLSFINDIRPVTFKLKAPSEFPTDWNSYSPPTYTNSQGDVIEQQTTPRNTDLQHGLIAQEVKAALETAGVSTFSGWSEREDGQQRVSKGMFVLPLINAVKELTTRLEAAEAKITALEG